MSEENPLARSHELLWKGLPSPRKGPKPKFTLNDIVTTAIALVDAEGIEALSMRSLAAELGLGTMSLYRYVPSKTELLNLMLDRVTDPGVESGGSLGATWREVLETSAWRARSLYLRHQWLLQINWTRPVLGPNAVADMELTMSGLTAMPFSDREKIMVLSLLDSFVTGAVRQELLYENAAVETGMTDEEFWGYQLPVLEEAMSSGNYPTMAAMDENSFDAGWEDTFAFGLKHLLDGLELEVGRREGGRRAGGHEGS